MSANTKKTNTKKIKKTKNLKKTRKNDLKYLISLFDKRNPLRSYDEIDEFNSFFDRFHLIPVPPIREKVYHLVDMKNNGKVCCSDIVGTSLAMMLCYKANTGEYDPYNPPYVTDYWDRFDKIRQSSVRQLSTR